MSDDDEGMEISLDSDWPREMAGMLCYRFHPRASLYPEKRRKEEKRMTREI